MDARTLIGLCQFIKWLFEKLGNRVTEKAGYANIHVVDGVNATGGVTTSDTTGGNASTYAIDHKDVEATVVDGGACVAGDIGLCDSEYVVSSASGCAGETSGASGGIGVGEAANEVSIQVKL
ncbi:unnamed protein product [Ilex paraguariensis]|uniref:Uncharacterized protein n=1 Tax=Ilex paraguariensis TaxID=185542 RepID=A0ABC8TKW1_9AQUA